MRKDLLDYTFEISVIIKGVDGILEIIGGFLLGFLQINTINNIAVWLTEHELSEDPSDILANALIQLSHGLSVNVKIFGAAYLLSHGLIKIILVWALLRHKLWAYPSAIIFLLVFIFYQIYRLNYYYSVWLLALTLFDLLIIFLTAREYKKLKNQSLAA